MLAAIEFAKGHDPYEVIVAVPVAPPDRLDTLRRRCDRVVCLEAPFAFWAVGQFYESFEEVDDEEVAQLLAEFAPAESSAS